MAYTTWMGGVGAIIILPIVLCRAGAIYLRANMIPISWQAGEWGRNSQGIQPHRLLLDPLILGARERDAP